MRGKLIFDVKSLEEITIDCRLKGIDLLGKLCIFDSLMHVFQLDEADCLIIAHMIRVGGIGKLAGLGAETEVIKIDRGLTEEAIRRIDDCFT